MKNWSGKKLAILFFHPTIESAGKTTTKPHHGRFFDEVAKGFKVTYLLAPHVSDRRRPEWVSKNHNVYDYELKSKSIKIFKVGSGPVGYLTRLFIYTYVLLRSQVILFFTPSIASLFFLPLMKALGKTVICYIANDPYSIYEDRFSKGVISRFLARWQVAVCFWADGLLVTGAQNQRRWSGHRNLERVTPLLNIDFKKIEVVREPRASRIPRSLLYVGPLAERKNIHLIIEALKRLEQAGEVWQLTVIGSHAEDGEEYFLRLEALVREHSLEQRVYFTGYVQDPEELDRHYQSATALMMPSAYEGFPKVVFEAMKNGCLPILSRIPSYDGILGEGRNCLFLPEISAQAITDTVLTLGKIDTDPIRQGNIEFMENLLKNPPAAQFFRLLEVSS